MLGTLARIALASLGLLRASMFLHELVHLRPGAIPGLRVAWNAVIGIPIGVPSFLFERVHRDHHRLSIYRTPRDPEHAPNDSTLAGRFALSFPANALGRARVEALAMEALCAAWVAWQRVEILHRFDSHAPLGTLERQVFDSVTVPHTSLATMLLLPVGIGYHALHHLDARLLYHALGAAHRRLLCALPADSAYHRTECRGLWRAIVESVARDRRRRAERAEEPGCERRGAAGRT